MLSAPEPNLAWLDGNADFTKWPISPISLSIVARPLLARRAHPSRERDPPLIVSAD